MATRKKTASTKTGSTPPKRITREWLDGLLDRKLPGVLASLGQNETQLAAEFVKITALQRSLYPPQKEPAEVIWMDWVDQDGNKIPR